MSQGRSLLAPFRLGGAILRGETASSTWRGNGQLKPETTVLSLCPTYVRTFKPLDFRYAFSSGILISPKWNTLAASRTAALPSVAAS